jgi:hypothetical protein
VESQNARGIHTALWQPRAALELDRRLCGGAGPESPWLRGCRRQGQLWCGLRVRSGGLMTGFVGGQPAFLTGFLLQRRIRTRRLRFARSSASTYCQIRLRLPRSRALSPRRLHRFATATDEKCGLSRSAAKCWCAVKAVIWRLERSGNGERHVSWTILQQYRSLSLHWYSKPSPI